MPARTAIRCVAMAKSNVESLKCHHCLDSIAIVWEMYEFSFPAMKPADSPWGYRATTCPGCKKAIIEIGEFYASNGAFKLRALAWPRTTARAQLAASVPAEFCADYKEACEVIDLSPKAAAALARRGLQHLLHEHLKIKARDLSAEIDDLLAQKVLPQDLAEDVDGVRLIGNFAAHPNKSEHSGLIVDVEPGEADWTLTVLYGLLDFFFVSQQERAARRDAFKQKLAAAKPGAAFKKPPT